MKWVNNTDLIQASLHRDPCPRRHGLVQIPLQDQLRSTNTPKTGTARRRLPNGRSSAAIRSWSSTAATTTGPVCTTTSTLFFCAATGLCSSLTANVFASSSADVFPAAAGLYSTSSRVSTATVWRWTGWTPAVWTVECVSLATGGAFGAVCSAASAERVACAEVEDEGGRQKCCDGRREFRRN